MSGVTFDPPLWLQRQAWVLAQLRLHDHKSILEIGCSVAPLLKAVLPPPLYLYPDVAWRERARKATGLQTHSIFDAGPIAPHRMTIMDIDYDALQEPIAILEKEKNAEGPSKRWYDLHVKVLCASLDQDMKAQVGQVDVAVATEVIEHLEEDMLARFAPSILGNYRPKVLLLTTPNHDFNVRIENGGEYPDPTGRTDRFFRHIDHKFEWTVEEFSKWCQDVARTHGYTVDIGGVGEDYDEDSLPSMDVHYPEASRYASQTAVFVRQDSEVEDPNTEHKTASSSQQSSDDSEFSVISHNDDLSFKSVKSSSAVSSDGFEIIDDKFSKEEVVMKTGPAPSSAQPAALDLDFFLHAEMMLPIQDDPEEDKSNIVDLTFNVILDMGKEIQEGEEDVTPHKTYEADLWLVWMCEDVRHCCQGRLDYWLDAIGVTFHEEGFTSEGDVKMLVKDEELLLSIQVFPTEEDTHPDTFDQDIQPASSDL